MALLMSVRSLAPGLAAGLAPGLTNTFRMRKAKLLGPSSRAPRPGRTRFSTLTASASPVKIAVIYYSTYGHVQKLAEAEAEGAKEVDGVDVTLMQFPEILSDEILTKMHAAPKADVPVATVQDLPNYDGFIMGFPTRYGTPPAQFKAFWDATGGLWVKGSLVGKAVTTFVGTGSQCGGQETTHLVSLPNFVHHGMIYIPPGYSFGPQMSSLDKPEGGAAYGAGVLAGSDGSRQPSEHELGYAKYQGKYFAGIVKRLAATA